MGQDAYSGHLATESRRYLTPRKIVQLLTQYFFSHRTVEVQCDKYDTKLTYHYLKPLCKFVGTQCISQHSDKIMEIL